MKRYIQRKSLADLCHRVVPRSISYANELISQYTGENPSFQKNKEGHLGAINLFPDTVIVADGITYFLDPTPKIAITRENLLLDAISRGRGPTGHSKTFLGSCFYSLRGILLSSF